MLQLLEVVIFRVMFLIFLCMVFQKYVFSQYNTGSEYVICPSNKLQSLYNFYFYLPPPNVTSDLTCWNNINPYFSTIQVFFNFFVNFNDFNWDIYFLVHIYSIWVLFNSFSNELKNDIHTRSEEKAKEVIFHKYTCMSLKMNAGTCVERVFVPKKNLKWFEVTQTYEVLRDACHYFNDISGNAYGSYLVNTIIYFATNLDIVVAEGDTLLALSFIYTALTLLLCADIVKKVKNTF